MLSRTLIAAAGNAGGGLDYWINEVNINQGNQPNVNISSSEDRESVFVRSSYSSTSKYIEIDNAGDYIRSGSDTLYPQYGYGFIPFDGSYLLQVNYGSQSRLYNWETGTSNTALQYSWNTVAVSSGSSGYLGTNGLQLGLTSDTVCYMLGQTEYYYAGPYLAAVAYMYVSTNHEPLASPVFNSAIRFNGYGTLGSSNFWNPSISKNTYDNRYSACWMESFSGSYIHLAEIDGSNNATERRTISLSDTPSNIFVDSTGKTSILTYRYNNQAVILRGSTAGSLSSITTEYKFSTTIYGGGSNLKSVMDSDDNIYILTDQMRLFKFTTANTIEWSVKLSDSRGSTDQKGFDLTLGVEDGTEILYIVKTQAFGTPINYRLYIWKLPLDVNNYTGTYGTYTISSFTSPTVTSGSVNNNAPSYGLSAKTMNNIAMNSPAQATELGTHTTNVTSI